MLGSAEQWCQVTMGRGCASTGPWVHSTSKGREMWWWAGKKHEVLPFHTAHMACDEPLGEQGRNHLLTTATADNTDNRTSLGWHLPITSFQTMYATFPFGKELLANCLERVGHRLGHSCFSLFCCLCWIQCNPHFFFFLFLLHLSSVFLTLQN